MSKLKMTLLAAVFAGGCAASAQKIAVVADHLYAMEGDGQGAPGVVLIENGKIAGVQAGQTSAPAGYETMHAAYVTPGLIDSDGTAGISGAYNIPADQDQDEATSPNTADVHVRDSLNPEGPVFQYVNSFGVTTMQIAPGPKNPIAGVAGVFKTVGPQSPFATADQLVVRAESAMVFNLGSVPKEVYGETHKAPMTRMKTAEMIRAALADAQAYGAKWDKWKQDGSDPAKAPALDAKLEALAKVASGKLPAVFNVYRADDIDTAIRIGSEFHLKYMLASVTEGYLIREKIHAAGVTCLVGAVMQPFDTPEQENATYENAALLEQADVPVSLMTGYEPYVPKSRILLFEAAIAAANGLGREGALRAITISAAKAIGVEDRVGSLANGKDADVVLFDGDPFEYTSHVLAVMVNGAVTYKRTPGALEP
ncbi:MAG: amidohydrolase family protein [Terracidiphilus sp.]